MDSITQPVVPAFDPIARDKRWRRRAVAIFVVAAGVGLLLSSPWQFGGPTGTVDLSAPIPSGLGALIILVIVSSAFAIVVALAWSRRMYWSLAGGLLLATAGVARVIVQTSQAIAASSDVPWSRALTVVLEGRVEPRPSLWYLAFLTAGVLWIGTLAVLATLVRTLGARSGGRQPTT